MYSSDLLGDVLGELGKVFEHQVELVHHQLVQSVGEVLYSRHGLTTHL